MSQKTVSSSPVALIDRSPPYSEEAEKGVLGSVLLDSVKIMDICLERQLVPESFYVPAHKLIFQAFVAMCQEGSVIDVLTVTERLKNMGALDKVGGFIYLDRLIDSTPTAAHAEYYIEIVRQKFLLRSIIDGARDAEHQCYTSPDSADMILSRVEQNFLNITERQHGSVTPWRHAVKQTMEHIETVFVTRSPGSMGGISTGFANFDSILQGLRPGEMVILAARPSMGKTSLAMNIVENVALGKAPDGKARPVGIFSLEMSHEALVMRMLCSHASVSAFNIMRGYVSQNIHGQLTQAASVLTKAPIYLDDTGGLDVMELRARARRMKKKYGIELIVIDYLQLLHSRDYAQQGRQIETAAISGNLKAMAKELKLPVFVLSQLSRAPEQRDKYGVPKLSDLRDSGAIEQDADVVCMLRRPCKYPGDEEHADDKTLAIIDVVKQRNGPTGEAQMNFEEEFTRFRDRAHGIDGLEQPAGFVEDEEADVEA
ncbi:MAG: replicative DNA helicase [Lentisphaerae bacterium]|nr:replicative DNA helicase [Lentisphaerota bacterium]